MTKFKNTIVTAASSIIIAAVMAVGLVPAFATISNPSRTVDTSAFATAAQLANYLPLSGGTLTGNLFGTNASMSQGLEAAFAAINAGGTTNTTLEVGGTASISGTVTLAGALNSSGTATFSGNIVIPAGAGASLATTGQLKYDTASASMKIYDGSNTVALGEAIKCFTIPYKNPTATNEFGAVPFFDGGTITQVSLNLASGSNAVGWNLKYGRPNAVTTAVFTANKSASSSANIVKYTSFTNSTPTDGDVLNLVISSASSKIEDLSVGVCYRK